MSYGIKNKSFGKSDPFTKFAKGGSVIDSGAGFFSGFDPISAGLGFANSLLGGSPAPAVSSATANVPVAVGGLNTPAYPFPFGIGAPSQNSTAFSEKVLVGVVVALAVSGIVLVIKKK